MHIYIISGAVHFDTESRRVVTVTSHPRDVTKVMLPPQNLEDSIGWGYYGKDSIIENQQQMCFRGIDLVTIVTPSTSLSGSLFLPYW